MIRIALAAAAAFALSAAAPALACGPDCPMHKVAAADKAEKKGEHACKCADPKDCKCPHDAKHAANCECPACHSKAEKKGETKKT